MRTATVRYTARVCTRASQHVGACIFLFCDMQRTLSADWFWRHLCTCLSLLLRLYSTNPPPHTLPYYPRTKHPRAPCPVSQATTLGRGLPPPIMGARRQNLRLARGSADSFFLRAHRYLHHGPPILHTWPRTLTTPLHATTLHLLPAHNPHLVAISILAINCLSGTCRWASPQ